ncbi:acetyl-CoA carboxylase carboxyl transferase subunit alpha [Actinomadura fibrosa]|uniref:Multifunctional fusion protein n=1 Tax=Actinomadura fibrosa TaxID=111802 RepID=A0ABW2XRB6_9ACTN|nr:acetyl-CoA carboxylase carboxyl transferase subunit alpha [Actinomadura fibrosa]
MTDTVTRPERTTTRWVRCGGCGSLLYEPRFARELRVCPGCGHHTRLTAAQRVASLLDRDSARPLGDPDPGAGEVLVDPLAFTAVRSYAEQLAEARDRTGTTDAVACARGTVLGVPVVLVAMDFRFLGGSLGCAVGEAVTRAAEAALEHREALVIVTASGGARMQEGAHALMQMAKTAQALSELEEAGIPTVTVVSDPTYGGVAASYASLTHVIIAEPGARMGFAGPRVIEQTIRERLPEGFQRAEHLLRNGLLDMVRPRSALRPTIARLAALGVRRDVRRDPLDDPVIRDAALLPATGAWETVQLARDSGRPTCLEHATRLLEGFEELHGDRAGSDCPAIVGGVGRLDGVPVMLIGHQKGHTTAELVRRRFGMASPAGYAKARRLMRMAESLGMPVVTLVDTPGAFPGVEAEDGGQAAAIAAGLRLMAGLRVPIVSVVTGEGGSGGALALAVADEVLMSANACYSVISPEGCASILWRDAARAPEAAGALRLTAGELLRAGIVDGVVPEPDGGAHRDPPSAVRLVGDAVSAALARLADRDPGELVRARRRRYRAFGLPAGARGRHR